MPPSTATTPPRKLGSLPEVGQLVDRYQVLAELAHGGMAAVYAVRRQSGRFQKLLAMKVLLPHLQSNGRFVDMFVDEARIAAHVQHPNVVQVFDAGQSQGMPYLVMEFLRGQPLAKILRQGRAGAPPALAREHLYRVFADVAAGLHAAHQARGPGGDPLGIVHRDVSPQNVHVGYDGEVKVVDFGIAVARGRVAVTRTGELKGKLDFVAPEQLSRDFEVRPWTDLWSFGVMVHQAFAGRRLFRGDSDAETLWRILNLTVPAAGCVDPELDGEVAACVDRCLERNPHRRPASAMQVAQVFRLAAESAGRPSADQLAAWIGQAFADQRAEEQERLRKALGEMSAGGEDTPSSVGVAVIGSQDTSAEASTRLLLRRPSRNRPRTRWLVGGVALVAASAAVALSTSSPRSDAPQRPAGAALRTAAAEMSAEPARLAHATASSSTGEEISPPERLVTVTLGDEVRRVLVDGEAVSERPIRLRLAPSQQVTLTLLGRAGERRTVVVDGSSDHLTLGVARASPGHAGGRPTVNPSTAPPAGKARPAVTDDDWMPVFNGDDSKDKP